MTCEVKAAKISGGPARRRTATYDRRVAGGRPATPPARRRDAARWQVADAHERFLAEPGRPVGDGVRPVVAESWARSLLAGVDPEASGAPLDLTPDELDAYRAGHPLAAAMPLVRHLLTQDAEEAAHIVAIGDAHGRLLWVEGHRRLCERAEDMHFVEGALWSEGGAGTNAPGTALALAAPVQIVAEEHFGVRAAVELRRVADPRPAHG